MEKKKYIVVLAILLCLNTVLQASHKPEIYKAYIGNDITGWKAILDEMSKTSNPSTSFRFELLNYQYGFIGWCLSLKKTEWAESYLAQGEQNLNILEKTGLNSSLINAYKAAFYGYKIGLSKMKAPFLGPKCTDCATLAIKQDSKNPHGYIQYANAQYHMPAVFGGSKKVALDFFKTAESLMQSNTEFIKNDWNYLNVLLMIAKVYSELNDNPNAKLYFEKILRIEPNFLLVKNDLYPNLLKKLK